MPDFTKIYSIFSEELIAEQRRADGPYRTSFPAPERSEKEEPPFKVGIFGI